MDSPFLRTLRHVRLPLLVKNPADPYSRMYEFLQLPTSSLSFWNISPSEFMVCSYEFLYPWPTISAFVASGFILMVDPAVQMNPSLLFAPLLLSTYHWPPPLL